MQQWGCVIYGSLNVKAVKSVDYLLPSWLGGRILFSLLFLACFFCFRELISWCQMLVRSTPRLLFCTVCLVLSTADNFQCVFLGAWKKVKSFCVRQSGQKLLSDYLYSLTVLWKIASAKLSCLSALVKKLESCDFNYVTIWHHWNTLIMRQCCSNDQSISYSTTKCFGLMLIHL